MTRGHDRGFTLIEVLLVTALIVVIGGATVPTIAEGMKRYALTSASQQVASTIRTARYQAVGRNTSIRVRFDYPSDGQYQILDDEDAEVGPVKFLPQGASFDSISGDIEFNSSGRVTALGGALPVTVVLANSDGATRTVSVAGSGRVELP
jgi:prepilin-type N-terminal cleavage/methylation domain-containing protein